MLVCPATGRGRAPDGCVVRALEVYRCEGATPVSWEKVFDVGACCACVHFVCVADLLSMMLLAEMSDTAGAAQVESNQVNRAAASFLKFVILSGWDDFVTVHRVSVEGKSMR